MTARTLPEWPTPGLWVLATLATGRTVPVDQPYPHVCGMRPGRAGRLTSRDCHACASAGVAALTVVT